MFSECILQAQTAFLDCIRLFSYGSIIRISCSSPGLSCFQSVIEYVNEPRHPSLYLMNVALLYHLLTNHRNELNSYSIQTNQSSHICSFLSPPSEQFRLAWSEEEASGGYHLIPSMHHYRSLPPFSYCIVHASYIPTIAPFEQPAKSSRDK
jgi:hypothetical protein